jgi:hypothetical protein
MVWESLTGIISVLLSDLNSLGGFTLTLKERHWHIVHCSIKFLMPAGDIFYVQEQPGPTACGLLRTFYPPPPPPLL